MSTGKKLRLLYADGDREALQPILQALTARGLRIAQTGDPGKRDVVLAVLSEKLYAEPQKTEALLSLVGAGAENVLPLQLDKTAIPEDLKKALYTRNIIPAAGRDPEQLAERIAGAVPPAPPILPWLLIAGALVLAAIVGLLLWRAKQPPEEPAPVMAEPARAEYYIPEGWTKEDLAAIEDVVIVGEQMEFYTKAQAEDYIPFPEWDTFAYRDYDDDGDHWFSREDGHEYRMTTYGDLRFLEWMPNLRSLTLAHMEAGQLPDLTLLPRLEYLMLMDSQIPDLEWVRGSKITKLDFINSTGSVTDLSPLTDCERLREVHVDVIHNRRIDFSAFNPPALNWLWINNGQDLEGDLDLSGLQDSKLQILKLDYELPLSDLDFLKQTPRLQELEIYDLSRLQDISAVAELKSLTWLRIGGCESIRDYSPIGGCPALEQLSIFPESETPLRDVSFLGGLEKLRDISLSNAELPDLDFLRRLSQYQTSLTQFSFSGQIGDWSGLAAVEKITTLSLDVGGALEQALPYLKNLQVANLRLSRVETLDLSELPRPSSTLCLERCGITDLSTLPEDWTAPSLTLEHCSALRSLEGLQHQSSLLGKGGTLILFDCPRLTDWSALEGMTFSKLSITGGFTLPDFSAIQARNLVLDSVADVEDLNFLDVMDNEKRCAFTLVGLEVDNLQPLYRFQGAFLAVPPELGEQAEDLVKAGNFDEFRIEYPQGGWEQDNSDFALLSLDELETLPPAMLRRVTDLCLAGDQVIDPERFEIWEDWDHRDKNGNPALVLHDRETDRESPLAPGVIDDLSRLSALTGLRRLHLYGQPLENLEGIQLFEQLEDFSARGCTTLTDASALFALPELRRVDLKCTAVASLQGVQNLWSLCSLDISNTRVDDLTPLADCDFSAAAEEGGFELHCNELDLGEEDFAAMARIRHFRELAFTDADPAVWIPALSDCEIEDLGAAGDLRSNEDLAAFAADHPELRKLWLGWMDEITDLTPLLSLEKLEEVSVHQEMKEAIASLESASYGFQLNITD